MDLAAEGITDDLKGTPLEIGKGVIRKEGKDVALIGYGNSVGECMKAAAMLEDAGLSATVMDARFCKPLDTEMIRRLAKEHPAVITVEEGSIGGFGSHVCQFLALEGLLDGQLKFRPMTLPDRYIEHGSQQDQLDEAGLTAPHIFRTAMALATGKKVGVGIEVLYLRCNVFQLNSSHGYSTLPYVWTSLTLAFNLYRDDRSDLNEVDSRACFDGSEKMALSNLSSFPTKVSSEFKSRKKR